MGVVHSAQYSIKPRILIVNLTDIFSEDKYKPSEDKYTSYWKHKYQFNSSSKKLMLNLEEKFYKVVDVRLI